MPLSRAFSFPVSEIQWDRWLRESEIREINQVHVNNTGKTQIEFGFGFGFFFFGDCVVNQSCIAIRRGKHTDLENWCSG